MTKLFTQGCRNTILCDLKIVFRKCFMRTKFSSNFFGFGRNISKLFAYNFQHVCHKRNLRLSGFFLKKNCWFWQIEFFINFFVFWANFFFKIFWGKNSTRLSKLHSRDPERSFEQKWFLRKRKILNYFGIIRKSAGISAEIFRGMLSKLPSRAREKTFWWI